MKTPEAYTRTAENPRAWFQAGDALLVAAHAIWNEKIDWQRPPTHEDAAYFSAFLLLAGFGIESNFKGLLVRQMTKDGKRVVQVKKKKEPKKKGTRERPELVPELNTHDLTDLAERTGIASALGIGERLFLKRLSVYSTWAGRYPVELKYKESDADRSVISSDWDEIESVIRRIKAADEELRIVRRHTS
jgi:hypothetical protein